MPIEVVAGLLAALLALGTCAGWLVARANSRRAYALQTRLWEDRLKVETLAAEVARRETSRSGDEIKTLRSRLGTVEAGLSASRHALDERTAELRTALDRLERAGAEADLATDTLAAREREVAELAPLRDTLATREAELAEAERERETLTRRVGELDRLRIGLQSEVTRLAARVESLDGQLNRARDEGQRELDGQRAAIRAANALVVRSRRETDALGAQVDDLTREMEALAAERDAATVEAERMATELRDARTRIRQEEVARQDDVAAKDAELGSLRARMERLDSLVRQLEDREALLRAALFERDEAERRLVDAEREHQNSLRILRSRIAGLERLEPEIADRDQRIAALERRMAQTARERDDALGREGRRAHEVETLRAEWRDRDRRFRRLATENEQLVGGLERRRRELEHALAARVAARRGNGGNGHRRHANGHAAPDADDLTAIKGIGPILARRLNVRGVYRFRDIAGWSEADIERFARALGAVGHRIRRDDWMAAARRAHLRKYGDTP